jgi:hypothetical protein
MTTQTRAAAKAANIARHEEANRRRAAEALARREERRDRHETHVDALIRGKSARLAERAYQRRAAQPILNDDDGDELMALRDAAANDRAYINYR